MLSIQSIRENPDLIASLLSKKHFFAGDTLNTIIALDAERREAQTKLDQALAESKIISKEIGALMQQGRRDEAEAMKTRTADLKDQSKSLSDRMEAAANEMHQLLLTLPNTPHHDVPEGRSPDDNKIVSSEGVIPVLPENAHPHWDLAREYDIIDWELGAKITGAGFPIYKGAAARLQRALISFFLDEAAKAGYLEIQPPYLINSDSGYGTGQLPDKDGQMYHIGIDNLYLIPTAEVPVTNIYRDMILDAKDLPVKNTAYSACFRREAGSYGKDVRGLNRLHQFDKVEIVQITRPEASYQALEGMLDHACNLLRALKLPFRVLLLCGGDMSFTSAKTFDLEVWSAAQKRWLEVSSVSNFEEFQANRMKLRYRDNDGRNKTVHTLNGSALALPRIVAALLENNQSPEGIHIPEVLWKYGMESVIVKR
jgi:seryl-tRNA synthetase